MIYKKFLIVAEILVSIPKSIYMNFKYLPFKKAIRLPILVSSKCMFLFLNGKLNIEGEIRTEMIKIGIGNTGFIDKKYCRTILEISKASDITFAGEARLEMELNFAMQVQFDLEKISF